MVWAEIMSRTTDDCPMIEESCDVETFIDEEKNNLGEKKMVKRIIKEWDDHKLEWYVRIVDDEDYPEYRKYPEAEPKPTYRLGYGIESNYKDW